MTGGIGFSSAGMKPPDAANKAFIPFFGYIDPIILIALVAFPVLCTLGVTALMMPVIPILIYIVGLIFPSSSSSRMKFKMKLHSPYNNSMEWIGWNASNPNITSSLFTPPTTSLPQTSSRGSLVSPASINRVLRLLEAAMQKF